MRKFAQVFRNSDERKAATFSGVGGFVVSVICHAGGLRGKLTALQKTVKEV